MSGNDINDLASRAAQQQALAGDHPATTDDKKPAKGNASAHDAAANGGKSQQQPVAATTPGIGAGPSVVNRLDSGGSESPARGRSQSRDPSAPRQDVNTGANGSGNPSASGKATTQPQAQRVDVAGRATAQPVQPPLAQAAAPTGSGSGVDEISIEPHRKALIDTRLSEYDPHNDPNPKTLLANDVVDVLQRGLFHGQGGEFGRLSPNEQRYFLSRALPMLPFDQAENLARSVRDDGDHRDIVARELLHRATQLAPGQAAQARAYTLMLLSTQKDPNALGQMLANEEGVKLAKTLGSNLLADTGLMTTVSRVKRPDPRLNNRRVLSDARDQILVGLNTVPITAANRSAIGEITFAIFQATSPFDLPNAPQAAPLGRPNAGTAPGLANHLAFALARDIETGNPVLATQRVEGLLNSGSVFLTAGSRDGRTFALTAALNNADVNIKEIDASRGDALRNPVIARAMAREIISFARREGWPIADPDKATERVAGILQGPGWEVILGPASTNAKLLALRTILSHPEINAASFESSSGAAYFYETSDPWYAISPAIAQMQPPVAAQPRPIGKIAFKNMLGVLRHEKPVLPKGVTISDEDMAGVVKAAREGGPLPAKFTENDFFPNSDVGEFADKLLAHAQPKDPPQFVVVPVTCVGREAGIGTSLLVGVQSGTDANGLPKFTYGDDQGRIYPDSTKESGRNFSDLRDPTPVRIGAYEFWHETNVLPAGMAIYRDPAGKLVVEQTPAARNKVHQVAHTAGQGFIFLAIGAAMVGTDGLASLLFAGAGAGGMGYSASEEADAIGGMLAHEESLKSRKGASHIFGFVASVAGAKPFAAGVTMAAAGVDATVIKQTTRILGRVAIGMNGISVGEQILDAATSPTPLTFEQQVQLAMSVAMFGHCALAAAPSPEITPAPRWATPLPEFAKATGKPAEPAKMSGPVAPSDNAPAAPAKPAQATPRKVYDPPAAGSKPQNSNQAPPLGPKKPPTAPTAPAPHVATIAKGHPPIKTVGNDPATPDANAHLIKLAANDETTTTQPDKPAQPVVPEPGPKVEKTETRPSKFPRRGTEPDSTEKTPTHAPDPASAEEREFLARKDALMAKLREPGLSADDKATINQQLNALLEEHHRATQPQPGEKVLEAYRAQAGQYENDLNDLKAMGDVDVKKLGFQELGKRLDTLDTWKKQRHFLTAHQEERFADLRKATVAEINVKDTASQLDKLCAVDVTRLDANALDKRAAHLAGLAKTEGITVEQKAEIGKLQAETRAARPAASPAPAAKPTTQPAKKVQQQEQPPETAEQRAAREDMLDRHAEVLRRHPVRVGLAERDLNEAAGVDPKKLGTQELGARLDELDKWRQYRDLTPDQKRRIAILQQATIAEINVKDTASKLDKLRAVDLTKLDGQALDRRAVDLNELAGNKYNTPEQKVEIAGLTNGTEAEIQRRAGVTRVSPRGGMVSLQNTFELVSKIRDFVRSRVSADQARQFDATLKRWLRTLNTQTTSTITVGEFFDIVDECAAQVLGDDTAHGLSHDLRAAVGIEHDQVLLLDPLQSAIPEPVIAPAQPAAGRPAPGAPGNALPPKPPGQSPPKPPTAPRPPAGQMPPPAPKPKPVRAGPSEPPGDGKGGPKGPGEADEGGGTNGPTGPGDGGNGPNEPTAAHRGAELLRGFDRLFGSKLKAWVVEKLSTGATTVTTKEFLDAMHQFAASTISDSDTFISMHEAVRGIEQSTSPEATLPLQELNQILSEPSPSSAPPSGGPTPHSEPGPSGGTPPSTPPTDPATGPARPPSEPAPATAEQRAQEAKRLYDDAVRRNASPDATHRPSRAELRDLFNKWQEAQKAAPATDDGNGGPGGPKKNGGNGPDGPSGPKGPTGPGNGPNEPTAAHRGAELLRGFDRLVGSKLKAWVVEKLSTGATTVTTKEFLDAMHQFAASTISDSDTFISVHDAVRGIERLTSPEATLPLQELNQILSEPSPSSAPPSSGPTPGTPPTGNILEKAETQSGGAPHATDQSGPTSASHTVPTEADVAKLRQDVATLGKKSSDARVAYERSFRQPSRELTERLGNEFAEAAKAYNEADARLTEALRAREEAAAPVAPPQSHEPPPNAPPSGTPGILVEDLSPEALAELDKNARAAEAAFNNSLGKGAPLEQRQKLLKEWQEASHAYEAAQERLWETKPASISPEQLSRRLDRLRMLRGDATNEDESNIARQDYAKALQQAEKKLDEVIVDIGTLVADQIKQGGKNSGALAEKLKLYDNLTEHLHTERLRRRNLAAPNFATSLRPPSASRGAAKLAGYVQGQILEIQAKQREHPALVELQKLYDFLRNEAALDRGPAPATSPTAPAHEPVPTLDTLSAVELGNELHARRAERDQAPNSDVAQTRYAEALEQAETKTRELERGIRALVHEHLNGGPDNTDAIAARLRAYDNLKEHLENQRQDQTIRRPSARRGAARFAAELEISRAQLKRHSPNDPRLADLASQHKLLRDIEVREAHREGVQAAPAPPSPASQPLTQSAEQIGKKLNDLRAARDRVLAAGDEPVIEQAENAYNNAIASAVPTTEELAGQIFTMVRNGDVGSDALLASLKAYDTISQHETLFDSNGPIERASAGRAAGELAAMADRGIAQLKQTSPNDPRIGSTEEMSRRLKEIAARETQREAAPAPTAPAVAPEELVKELDTLRAARDDANDAVIAADKHADTVDPADNAAHARAVADIARAADIRYKADVKYADALRKTMAAADPLAREIIDLAGKQDTSDASKTELTAKLETYDRLTEHLAHPYPEQTVGRASAVDGAAKAAKLANHLIKIAEQRLTPAERVLAADELAKLEAARAHLEELAQLN
jgi:hypothetical protein